MKTIFLCKLTHWDEPKLKTQNINADTFQPLRFLKADKVVINSSIFRLTS